MREEKREAQLAVAFPEEQVYGLALKSKVMRGVRARACSKWTSCEPRPQSPATSVMHSCGRR
jgi:hypothetical protein